MWEALKNAIIGVKEAVGLEIPGLPADLGSLVESATTVVQDFTNSATGLVDEATSVVDGATAATDAITGLPVGDILPE